MIIISIIIIAMLLIIILELDRICSNIDSSNKYLNDIKIRLGAN